MICEMGVSPLIEAAPEFSEAVYAHGQLEPHERLEKPDITAPTTERPAQRVTPFGTP